MDEFRYSPLKKLTSMRLLTIIDVDEHNPIRCELFDVDLDTQDIPRYTALSYCWGDQRDTRDIVCNDRRLTITANLDLALRMTHPHNPVEAIWADQICISQSDAQEKAQQIQVMTLIYQAAWTVIGWLGPEDPTTGIGVDQVEKVGITHYHETNKETYSTARIEDDMGSNRATSSSLLKSIENDATTWLAFSRFFDKPWFSRVWVVQEMLPTLQTHLTRKIDAFVLCGSHVVNWTTVFYAALWAHSHGYGGHGFPKHPEMLIDGVNHTVRLRISAFAYVSYVITQNPMRSIGRYTFEILELLSTFRSREATDPRDKVFGLLGLSNFNQSVPSTGLLDRSDLITIAKVPVDYSLPIMETYRNFARAHIEDAVERAEGKRFDFMPPGHPNHSLEILDHTASHSTLPGWPSWVPDWRVEGYHGHLYFPKTYPSRTCNTTISTVVHEHPDLNCLKVDGLMLGRVGWIHEASHASGVTLESDPRNVGSFVASQIGSKYRYGSKQRNPDPEAYRENKVVSESGDDIDVRERREDPWQTPEVAFDRKLTERGLHANDMDSDSAEQGSDFGETMIDDDVDELEDTETAVLWTLTLNQIPPIFTEANIDPDEYARTKVLYDSLDIFRSQTFETPMPAFTPSQFELNRRLSAVWTKSSGEELSNFLNSCLCERRLFYTDTGYLGLAHDDVKVGDEAAILFGMGTTCILRPFAMDSGEAVHKLVGSAWIRGANHGEAIEDSCQNGVIRPGQAVGRPITLR